MTELDALKAIGPDYISPWVLREGAEEMYELVAIFNWSSETGKPPDVWKTENIIPIFKHEDRRIALNYSTVSPTCFVYTVMKMLIRKTLMEHLERNILINNCRQGFRYGKSCLENLLEYYDKVINVGQEKERVMGGPYIL